MTTTKRDAYMRSLDRRTPRIELTEAEDDLQSWQEWIRSCKALVEDAIDSHGEVELERIEGEDGNQVWSLTIKQSGRGWKVWRNREVAGLSAALVAAAKELLAEVETVAKGVRELVEK